MVAAAAYAVVEAAQHILDGRKHMVRKTMWYDVDFLRHVAFAPGEAGATTCKHFLKDDFIWWVIENLGGQRKNS